ncbi:MAG: hypothetical protein Q7S35_13990 [Candidatus Limnocylindrales bacterium]|nr:hypothetical protein [Candidatus Limnocylindrales bacterium]
MSDEEGSDVAPRDGPEPSAAVGRTEAGSAPAPAVPREPRPMIERLGLAAVALVLAVLFGGVAAASWVGGEPFLAAMGAIGSLMTLWVGALTLIRG